MKKSILIIALITLSTVTFSQTKPKYKYKITLGADEFNRLLELVHNYKDDQVYNQKLSSDQKVTYTQNIDIYLFNLSKTVKIDSVLIDTLKPIKK